MEMGPRWSKNEYEAQMEVEMEQRWRWVLDGANMEMEPRWVMEMEQTWVMGPEMG